MQSLYEAKDWVFDLDNTLYPAHSDLFPQIQVKMNEYVAKKLNLSLIDARIVQKKYYVEYGTTLNGMMIHHNIDPHDYLDAVHDIDYSCLAKDNELRETIQKLNARKLVFTNGSKKHAQNAIAALGLEDVFDDIIDIAATNFIPKPQLEAFEALVKSHNVNPYDAVMVEDLPKNLLTAHDMGFKTILVWSDKIWLDEPKGHAPAGLQDTQLPHIHFHTKDLSKFIAQITNLEDKNDRP